MSETIAAPAFDPFEAAYTAAGTPPAPGREARPPDLIPIFGPNGEWKGYERPPGWVPPAQTSPDGVAGGSDIKAPAASPEAIPGTAPGAAPATAPPEPGTPAAKPFDPFEAAGAPPLATAGAASGTTAEPGKVVGVGQTSAATQELREQPWYQGLWDAFRTADTTMAGLPASFSHGATMGFEEVATPILPALVRWSTAKATGAPISFTDAYEEASKRMSAPRKEFTEEHPDLAYSAELAGGLANTPAVKPLFAGARAAKTLGTRAIDAGRNIAASAALGAGAGFGMTDGTFDQRLENARQGAVLGGALGTGIPAAVAGVGAVRRALTPKAQVNRLAGEVLQQQTPGGVGGVPPTPATAPIPHFPLDSGAAFNDPGLAAMTRQANTVDNAGAVAQRTAQSNAIRGAATTAQAGGTRLGTGRSASEAAASFGNAVRDASDVIRQEEERLWTKPTIAAKALDMPTLKQQVARAVAALPERFKAVIARTPDLGAALEDLANLSPNATLADVNAVRSDLLGTARSLPADQRFAKRVANTAAEALLKAVESNPALRTDAQAWSDYVRARNFTAKKWDVLGNAPFQNLINPTKYGNTNADTRSLISKLFGFGDKNAGEAVPGGIAKLGSFLDDIRRTWGGLHTAGQTPPGMFQPSAAFGAKADLGTNARDMIISSMLDTATSVERGAAGEQHYLLNKLSDWIDTNRGWLDRSGLLSSDQADLLGRIRDAAVMGARTENLRGGKGSETFERLMKHDGRWVDVFSHPMLTMGVGAAGGIAGQWFGEFAIGAMVAMGMERSAGAMLQRLYAIPRGELQQKLLEATRNPAIAHDLMQKANAANAKKLSPDTLNWMRTLLSEQPAAQTARALSDPLALPAPAH